MPALQRRSASERLAAALLTGAAGHLVAALGDWAAVLRKVVVARWKGTDPWA